MMGFLIITMPCEETEGELRVVMQDWSDAPTGHGKPRVVGEAPEARTRQGRIH